MPTPNRFIGSYTPSFMDYAKDNESLGLRCFIDGRDNLVRIMYNTRLGESKQVRHDIKYTGAASHHEHHNISATKHKHFDFQSMTLFIRALSGFGIFMSSQAIVIPLLPHECSISYSSSPRHASPAGAWGSSSGRPLCHRSASPRRP
jgi:hypothetical protein